jgi:hypothetical protein
MDRVDADVCYTLWRFQSSESAGFSLRGHHDAGASTFAEGDGREIPARLRRNKDRIRAGSNQYLW